MIPLSCQSITRALWSVDGHQLSSLNGEQSFCFEYLPPDLEQLSETEIEGKFNALENDLLTADFGPWAKIYAMAGDFYINSGTTPKLGEANVTPCDSGIEPLVQNNTWNEVEFYENYFTIKDYFCRILTVKRPPTSLIETSLHTYADFILCFRRHTAQKARMLLDFRRRIHFSGLFKAIRDINSENAYKEAEATLEGLSNGSTALFDTELFFILKEKTKHELDEETQHFLDRMKGLDAEILVESRALSYFFHTIVPGVAPSFKRKFLASSEYLAGLIPFCRDHLMPSQDQGLTFKARSKAKLYFDLFSPVAHNYNALITGTSGQGKSMLANKILKFELERGTKALCLDLGNSFRKNALFNDGLIFSEKFNPLQFRNPRYLKEFVLSILDEKLSKKEEGRLFDAIKNIMKWNVTTFDNFLLALEVEFPGISHYFAEVREYFSDDVFREQNFIYSDLGNYPDNIKAPLVIFLIECFKNMLGRKIFIFDECWNLLSKNADYIAECFRTFRKHDASAVALSQNLDDFSETQLGRVIIQNTYFKFFFKQNLKTSEFVSEHLAKMVASVYSKKGEYSEFVVASENICKPTRFYATPLEYELFTSDKQDLNHFENYMSEKGRFLTYRDALINYTKIKHPRWSHP
ncbi:MAG: hypothetical protein A2X86_19775 [Bdellovibrionales bacterium GWA2_49_15]|nr:MAG: hypothetical protein A2X86_19775 [Bdellovibrionales bacterium GWA2_49_15]HAZ12499.1 hypothetical protein [Bdellovibrionales bacterium]